MAKWLNELKQEKSQKKAERRDPKILGVKG